MKSTTVLSKWVKTEKFCANYYRVQKENDADYLNMVMDENPDRLEASYGKLVPILVKAIQELSTKVQALEAVH